MQKVHALGRELFWSCSCNRSLGGNREDSKDKRLHAFFIENNEQKILCMLCLRIVGRHIVRWRGEESSD